MTQAQYEARRAWIERELARNAELRGHSPRAADLAMFALTFVVPCMATGAVIVATTILLTKVYLG